MAKQVAEVSQNPGESVIEQFPHLQGLMSANEKWATEIKAQEPELLNTLSKGQVSLTPQQDCLGSRRQGKE
jgi:carbonic anhydrase